MCLFIFMMEIWLKLLWGIGSLKGIEKLLGQIGEYFILIKFCEFFNERKFYVFCLFFGFVFEIQIIYRCFIQYVVNFVVYNFVVFCVLCRQQLVKLIDEYEVGMIIWKDFED